MDLKAFMRIPADEWIGTAVVTRMPMQNKGGSNWPAGTHAKVVEVTWGEYGEPRIELARAADRMACVTVDCFDLVNPPLEDLTLERLLAMLPEDFIYRGEGEAEVSYFMLVHSSKGCACTAVKETDEDQCEEVWVDDDGEDDRLSEHGKTPREAVAAMLRRLQQHGHVNF